VRVPSTPAVATALHDAVLDWYALSARDLAWRRPTATPWGVLVSELMLQQTPVARVEPVWRAWMRRWPGPADLAAEPPGEAVRAWGRLGYPRRALRLHACAVAVVDTYDGVVPADGDRLRDLPGVGAYTAAAVAAFAHGRRTVVLDTNVRRVLARLRGGAERPAGTGPSRSEHDTAARLLPADPPTAARWSVALMELGAVVCTARAPRCGDCPVSDHCAWLALGAPPGPREPATARTQAYAGTDRQCRGRLLAVLRETDGPVTEQVLHRAWDEPVQRSRALAGLLADGLVEPVGRDAFALPGTAH